jgi:hypothetical protein
LIRCEPSDSGLLQLEFVAVWGSQAFPVLYKFTRTALAWRQADVTNAVSAGSFAITLQAAGDLHHVRCDPVVTRGTEMSFKRETCTGF